MLAVLIAVPEPHTYALMLVGIGLMAGVVRCGAVSDRPPGRTTTKGRPRRLLK